MLSEHNWKTHLCSRGLKHKEQDLVLFCQNQVFTTKDSALANKVAKIFQLRSRLGRTNDKSWKFSTCRLGETTKDSFLAHFQMSLSE